jgi:hypothetical protein
MGDFRTHTAEDLAAGLSADEWHRLPAGQGSKGQRLYDWARVRLFRLQTAHPRSDRNTESSTLATEASAKAFEG